MHKESEQTAPIRLRKENIMKEFWNYVQTSFTAVGGWLGWFLEGCDGLVVALIIFVVL